MPAFIITLITPTRSSSPRILTANNLGNSEGTGILRREPYKREISISFKSMLGAEEIKDEQSEYRI